MNELKAARTKHRDRMDEHLSLEIELASKRNNFALAWKLSRQLSARYIGKQKRLYRVLRASRPCSWEWTDVLAQPGLAGGLRATPVDFDAVLFARNNEPAFLFDLTPRLKELALEDVKGIRQSLRTAKRRKAVPDWSAPGEIWWLLFHPKILKSSIRQVRVDLKKDQK